MMNTNFRKLTAVVLTAMMLAGCTETAASVQNDEAGLGSKYTPVLTDSADAEKAAVDATEKLLTGFTETPSIDAGGTKDDLTKVIESFSLPDKDTDYLIFSGQYLEAKAAYKEIYGKAKKKIYIVDNYIDIRTLVLLNDISGSVEVIVFSDNIGKGLHKTEFSDFCKENTIN